MHKIHSVQFSATEFIRACMHADYDFIKLTELVGVPLLLDIIDNNSIYYNSTKSLALYGVFIL